jgi:HAD superfamily hydrolase (TIGR01509 family)
VSALPAAVLFDLDGTLVDTEPSWMDAEQALARAHDGRWSREQAVSCIGNPIPVSAARLRDEGGVRLPVEEIVDRLLDTVVAYVGVTVPWQPGARELVASLKAAGVPLALVTMSYRRLADAVVADLPAATFTAVVTGDEVRNGKPHPEPYLTAADQLGVDPGDCVVVEDSPTGIASGLAAGATVVAVPHDAPLPDDRAVTVVASLVDLDPAVLANLVRERRVTRS